MKTKKKKQRRQPQQGYVYEACGSWVIRLREQVNERGELRWVHRGHKLFEVSDTHPDERSVRDSQEVRELLLQVNRTYDEPTTQMTMGEFVKERFFPWVEKYRRPATLRCYRLMWNDHVAARCRDYQISKVEPADITEWLEDIAAKDKNGDERIAQSSLKRMRALLSTIFRLALDPNMKCLPRNAFNPVRGAFTPPPPLIKADAYKVEDEEDEDDLNPYSLEDVFTMLRVLHDPARVVVAVAGFVGLRHGELMGLDWLDWRGSALWVKRSVWNGIVVPLKTKKSRGAIPLIKPIAGILEAWRLSLGNPKSGWIFPCEHGESPIALSNVVNRQIKPALERCELCGQSKSSHKVASHQFVRDKKFPEWRGWHPFRYGLATNLNSLGVPDMTIQKILRHADVATTRKHYIKPVDADAINAMHTLEASLCAISVRNVAESHHVRIN